jgi:hypothetical protein
MMKKKMSVGRYDLAGKDSVVDKDHAAFCILYCTALRCIAQHCVIESFVSVSLDEIVEELFSSTISIVFSSIIHHALYDPAVPRGFQYRRGKRRGGRKKRRKSRRKSKEIKMKIEVIVLVEEVSDIDSLRTDQCPYDGEDDDEDEKGVVWDGV